MTKTRRLAAALTLGAIVLAGITACGSPDHGIVHDKRHEDAYVYTTQLCTSYGKYGCTVWIPQLHHVPASWALDVYNGDEHGWREVSQQLYDATQVGDTVDFRTRN